MERDTNKLPETIKITWANGFVQTKTLTRCRKGQGEFTMNSPIYQAIEDGSFCIDTGFGKHHFTVE